VSGAYPLWTYFPSRARPPAWVHGVVAAFADAYDGDEPHMTSDQKLAQLRPALIELGFEVEGGKKAADKLRRPVLFGELGVEERAFEVDAFHTEQSVALEIEAGRGTQGNAIYRDLIQTSLLIDAQFLVLAVLVDYRFTSGGKSIGSPDYRKTISLLDAIYASNRLVLPLEGVLIVGY
jgi:hypothetical protein